MTASEGLTEVRSYLSDDRDHAVVHRLHVYQGGNGDWYVQVLPDGDRMGPAVRICTSGGAAVERPDLPVAVRRLYDALGAPRFTVAHMDGIEPEPDIPEPEAPTAPLDLSPELVAAVASGKVVTNRPGTPTLPCPECDGLMAWIGDRERLFCAPCTLEYHPSPEEWAQLDVDDSDEDDAR